MIRTAVWVAAAMALSTFAFAQAAPEDVAQTPPDGLAQQRGQAKIDGEIVPAYEREFAEVCPPGGTRLRVDSDSFRGDAQAMAAFTASAVSDPSNRALGSLLHVLKNECGDAAGRAAVNATLREVRVRHQRAHPAPQAVFVDGVLTITVDVLQRKPPTVQQIEAVLAEALN